MIKRDPDGQQDEISFFVTNLDLRKADPMSLKFSRFYERHPDYDGPSVMAIGRTGDRESLRQHENWTGPYCADLFDVAHIVHEWTRGAHIVGAVPNFDTEMLDRVMRFSRLVPAWHYHLIDVENLAAGWLAAHEQPPSPPWESDELSLACNVSPPSDEERHTAMGDADWAMRLYDKIMKERKFQL